MESFSKVKAVKVPLYIESNGVVQSGKATRIQIRRYRRDYLCGKELQIIQNEDIATQLLKFIQDTSYEVLNVRSVNNTRFDVTLIDRKSLVTIGNEPAYKTAIITNSYDGSVRFSATFGVNIQICGNGARATKPIDGLVFKHTNSNIDFSGIYKSAGTLDRVLEKFNEKMGFEWRSFSC